MNNYKMKLESRKDHSWFEEKVISNKRLIFAFIYYFSCHLFLFPLATIKLLSIFTNWPQSQIETFYQMFSDVVSGLIIILILWPLLADNLERFFQKWFQTVFSSIKWYVPSILVNAGLNYLVIFITGIEESTNQNAVLELLKTNFWAIAIPAIIVAPIIEELIFRGIIFRSLRSKGFVVAALTSGLAFGLLHCFSDILTQNWMALAYVVVYMSMGVFMCKAYEDSENIFGSIILHLINNTISIVLLLLL